MRLFETFTLPPGDNDLPPLGEPLLGNRDPYLYHSTNKAIPLQRFQRGLLPSRDGYSGPGVYLANTVHNTLWHVDETTARVFRLPKTTLVQQFGLYPDVEDGLEFDPDMGEVLLSGNRIIPANMLEVYDQGWKPLVTPST